MNAQEELARGLVHHRAGRFGDARRCYEKIFAVQSDHARALELAGLASLAMGQSPVGVAFLERASAAPATTADTWFHLSTAYLAEQRWASAFDAARKACALKPDLVEAWCAVGMSADRLTRWSEAIAAYETALRLRPDFADASCNLGGVFLKTLDYARAEKAFARAVELKPASPEALNGLGVVSKQRAQLDAAAEFFRRATQLRPTYSEALYNLGNVLQAQENGSAAIDAYRQALQANPKMLEAAHNLACALIGQREFAEAIVSLRKVIGQQPEHADAYNHLGNALLGLHRFDEAIAAHEKAIAVRPGFADALSNLGNVFLALNRPTAALRYLRAAAISDPDSKSIEFNTSVALLASGQWQEGFQKYERRWDTEQKLFRKHRPEPLWLGRENLRGKSILLHSEQGIGDTLQFVRYASALVSMGATVSLQVQAPLHSLLKTFPRMAAVYSKNESPSGFDYQCPLGSLPLALGVQAYSLPYETPYLFAEPDKVGAWRRRLSAVGASSRIGLVCSGNARHKNDHHRSIPLRALADIARAASAPLHLVQKEFRETDRDYLRAGGNCLATPGPERGESSNVEQCDSSTPLFVDWSTELIDFQETAALVEALDLIITVDTSVAHLAGAMGKPTWILLPYAADWRWLSEGRDTMWYPSARLFRQQSPGNWNGVVQEVVSELRLRPVHS